MVDGARRRRFRQAGADAKVLPGETLGIYDPRTVPAFGEYVYTDEGRLVGYTTQRGTVVDRAEVDNPAAWLTTTTTRLALDRLRAARRERERYVGPWLPEPVATGDEPAEAAELAESLTLGFLTMLEQLSPIERAVLLADRGRLDPVHIERDLATAPPAARPRPEPVRGYNVAKRQAVLRFTRDYLAQLLPIHGGNISRAARAAGVPRQTLHRLLRWIQAEETSDRRNRATSDVHVAKRDNSFYRH